MMIAQRTKTRVLAPLSTRANASVRLVSSFYLVLAYSQVGRASQWISRINLNAARSSHDHQRCDVCSALCPRYNPHSQPSLRHPTL
jgi:hypothetical protein